MGDFDYRNLDDIIHSRVRLAIMSFLMTANRASFPELKKQLSLSDGNLSTHLRKLEDSGYLIVDKQFIDRKPSTIVSLTTEGKTAFSEYLLELTAMVQGTADSTD